MINFDTLTNYFEHTTYLGIFLVLAFFGHFIPIPVEIILVSMGYITALGYLKLYFVIPLGILGLLTGDALIFYMARRGSHLILKSRKKFKPETIEKYEELMKNNSGKTIFLLRFIVGLRILSPLLSGSLNVRYSTFLFFDFLALLIYVPFLIFLGFHFHTNVLLLISEVEIIRHVIFLLVASLVGLGISAYVWKKYFR